MSFATSSPSFQDSIWHTLQHLFCPSAPIGFAFAKLGCDIFLFERQIFGSSVSPSGLQPSGYMSVCVYVCVRDYLAMKHYAGTDSRFRDLGQLQAGVCVYVSAVSACASLPLS